MKRHLTEEELIQHQFKLASDEQAAGGWAEHLAGCDDCRQRLELLGQKFTALDLLAEDMPASEELISQTIVQARKPAPPKVVSFGKYHWIATAAAVLVVGFVLMTGNLSKQEHVRRESIEGLKLQSVRPREKSASVPQVEEEPEVMLVAKDLADERNAKLQEALASRQMASKSAAAPPGADAASPTDSLGAVAPSWPDSQPELDQYAFAPSVQERAPTTAGSGAAAIPTQVRVSDQQVQSLTVGPEDSPTYATELAAADVSGLTARQIPEKPPFAPASAIELVTLPRRDNVQLTIYNSADLTLVRERRNLTLKQGWNWLQLMWANTLIDPTSLSLEPAAQVRQVDVQQLVFPARLRELGRWLIRSEISGQVPFEITYFTSGLTWRAFYTGTLSQDEKTMRLAGYVRIANNSGEDYENAQTRLLVGKVNVLDEIADLAKRQYAYGKPGLELGLDECDLDVSEDGAGVVVTEELGKAYATLKYDGLERKEIKKEGLSEYFLYTIEGTETIADKWGKRLPSFDVEDIDVESLYKYDEERWGNQAMRFVSFANDDEHNLGETPIPDGAVKIYGRAGEQGHLSYVGGTDIKYIPVDEEVELNLGSARLVEVEPKLMAFETENYVFDNKGNVAGWDEIRSWQIEITNSRALPIEIEITRDLGTAYWTLQTEMPYEKHDATHARFETPLEPQSKQLLSYTLATYHGRRQEQVSQ